MASDPYRRIAARLGYRLVDDRPLPGGVSAEMRVLDVLDPGGRARRVVVRQTGERAWKGQGHDAMAREHDVLAALAAEGLPVPRPLLLDESRTLLPRPYVVLEWIEGTTGGPPPPLAIPVMADFLARLHGLRVPALGLPDLPGADDPAGDAAALLSELRNEPVRFLQPKPRSQPPVLLHGDYWPANLLWRDDTLVGVIDWEDTALGDPEADLAGARFELTMAYDDRVAERFDDRYRAVAPHPVDDHRLGLWTVCATAGCLLSLGEWGLEPKRERHVRATADRVLTRTLARLRRTGAVAG